MNSVNRWLPARFRAATCLARILPAVALLAGVGCGGSNDGDDQADAVAVRNAGITLWRSLDAALIANTAAMDFGAGRRIDPWVADRIDPWFADRIDPALPGRIDIDPQRIPGTLRPAHEYGITCPTIDVNVIVGGFRIFVVYGDIGCASELSGQTHSGYVQLDVDLPARSGTLTAVNLITGDYRVDGIIGASYVDTTVMIDARELFVGSPDGSVQLTSEMGITWSKGGTRLLLSDDSWTIRGTALVATLDFKSGAVYDVMVDTAEPIVATTQCPWPVSGRLSIERREPPLTATLDFGSGACDSEASLTVAGRTKTIDLDEGQD